MSFPSSCSAGERAFTRPSSANIAPFPKIPALPFAGMQHGPRLRAACDRELRRRVYLMIGRAVLTAVNAPRPCKPYIGRGPARRDHRRGREIRHRAGMHVAPAAYGSRCARVCGGRHPFNTRSSWLHDRRHRLRNLAESRGGALPRQPRSVHHPEGRRLWSRSGAPESRCGARPTCWWCRNRRRLPIGRRALRAARS